MIVQEAIKQMRYLSSNGIPFSFEFISTNQTTNQSKGVVVVDKALLRTNRQTKNDTVISYTDLTTDEPKSFHLPLLTKLNGKLLKHEY